MVSNTFFVYGILTLLNLWAAFLYFASTNAANDGISRAQLNKMNTTTALTAEDNVAQLEDMDVNDEVENLETDFHPHADRSNMD
ncbi:hypothetical protein GGF37_002393 [Kickxella alabastrina]|nr:hypothetical protein GGF37_002393 [Kickxella alabastrina]